MTPAPKPGPKPPKRHTTPQLRNRVWAAFEAGKPAAVIADEEGIKESLVYGIRKRFKTQNSGVSLARGRPPPALNKHEKRHILTAIANDPLISCTHLRNIHAPDVSVETIRRYLKAAGIVHPRPAAEETGHQVGEDPVEQGRFEKNQFEQSWFEPDQVEQEQVGQSLLSDTMAPTYTEQSPTTLLQAFLSAIETQIVPLTSAAVASGGNKIFGAAILSRTSPDLAPVVAGTNNERASPLLHGEVDCIQRFFALPASQRPSPRDCLFLATHEPCSLCLSAIAWAGFDNFYHLFTYEDSRDLFAIPHDIRILDEVFRVPAAGGSETEAARAQRPLYNRNNGVFTATSLAELVARVEDPGERERWRAEMERVKGLYGALSEVYQEAKRSGAESASFWK